MTWLLNNWILLLLVLCMGMMFFMHGGHGKSDVDKH